MGSLHAQDIRQGPGGRIVGELSLYCAAWKCVVTNDGNWRWSVTPDLVTMQFVNPYNRWRVSTNANLVKITFTPAGKTEKKWIRG